MSEFISHDVFIILKKERPMNTFGAFPPTYLAPGGVACYKTEENAINAAKAYKLNEFVIRKAHITWEIDEGYL